MIPDDRHFVDVEVLLRHLTSDPPALGRRATAFLCQADRLVLTDVVLVQLVAALEDSPGLSRSDIAKLARAAITFDKIEVADRVRLLRAVELYEDHGATFPKAHLVATAEAEGAEVIAFDVGLGPVSSAPLIEP